MFLSPVGSSEPALAARMHAPRGNSTACWDRVSIDGLIGEEVSPSDPLQTSHQMCELVSGHDSRTGSSGREFRFVAPRGMQHVADAAPPGAKLTDPRRDGSKRR